MEKAKNRRVVIISIITALLALAFLTGVVLFFLNLKLSSDKVLLDDAAIDEETGAFAVEWFDSCVHVNTYDAMGNLLFNLDIPFSETAGGITNLYFKDGFLHVQYIRNKIETVYDMTGTLKEKFTCDSDSMPGTWHQFKQTIEKDFYLKVANVNGTTYSFQSTRVFKSIAGVRNVFIIKNDKMGEKIVWDCNKLK